MTNWYTERWSTRSPADVYGLIDAGWRWVGMTRNGYFLLVR